MIDISRRDLMKLMAIVGLIPIVGSAAPAKLTLKARKHQFYRDNTHNGKGYYGFGETW